MNPTNALLDKVKTSAGFPSDYKLAKALKTSPSRISNYRAYTSEITDEDFLIKLAEVGKLDPVETVAEFYRAQAKTAYVAKFWSRVADMARTQNLSPQPLKSAKKTTAVGPKEANDPAKWRSPIT